MPSCLRDLVCPAGKCSHKNTWKTEASTGRTGEIHSSAKKSLKGELVSLDTWLVWISARLNENNLTSRNYSTSVMFD